MKIKIGFIIICSILIISYLIFEGPSEEKILNVIDKYNKVIYANNIKSVIVYCDYTNDTNLYRITINQELYHKILRKKLKLEYRKKNFSGHFDHHYLIKIILDNNQRLFFRYEKEYNADSVCKWKFEHRGKYIKHSYNDCTQLTLLENIAINENTYLNNYFTELVVSYYNFELIDFFEKYVDQPIQLNPNKYLYKKESK